MGVLIRVVGNLPALSSRDIALQKISFCGPRIASLSSSCRRDIHSSRRGNCNNGYNSRPVVIGSVSRSGIIDSDIYGAGWDLGWEEVKISVWWDFENCNVPVGIDGYKISSHIITGLRMSGFKGPVTISAYGDTLQLSRTVQEMLTATGIHLHHVPSGGKESDSSDRALLVDLLLWTVDNPPPAHLFLISGDRDFSAALHKLRMRNYNILLAFPGGTTISPSLLAAANRVWQWNSLVRGEVLIASSSLDVKPVDSGTNARVNKNFPPFSYLSNSSPAYAPPSSSPASRPPPSPLPASPSPAASPSSAPAPAHSPCIPTSLPAVQSPLSPSFHSGIANEAKTSIGNISSSTPNDIEGAPPADMLTRFSELLDAHPEGIWMGDLGNLLASQKIQFDSDYFGHKKLLPFLLTIPKIVRVRRMLMKDNKTWSYIFFPGESKLVASEDIGQMSSVTGVPLGTLEQLQVLLSCYPEGIWLNEFQSESVTRGIQFYDDFFGHHKLVPLLLTLPEIVRVERRITSDKKTWNYFFISSGGFGLSCITSHNASVKDPDFSVKNISHPITNSEVQHHETAKDKADNFEEPQASTSSTAPQLFTLGLQDIDVKQQSSSTKETGQKSPQKKVSHLRAFIKKFFKGWSDTNGQAPVSEGVIMEEQPSAKDFHKPKNSPNEGVIIMDECEQGEQDKKSREPEPNEDQEIPVINQDDLQISGVSKQQIDLNEHSASLHEGNLHVQEDKGRKSKDMSRICDESWYNNDIHNVTKCPEPDISYYFDLLKRVQSKLNDGDSVEDAKGTFSILEESTIKISVPSSQKKRTGMQGSHFKKCKGGPMLEAESQTLLFEDDGSKFEPKINSTAETESKHSTEGMATPDLHDATPPALPGTISQECSLFQAPLEQVHVLVEKKLREAEVEENDEEQVGMESPSSTISEKLDERDPMKTLVDAAFSGFNYSTSREKS